ncbi:MAG: DUF86 domain-containing protein [Selenomonadaceae bacterium]|nr:DUF86 domain-containing protein [Selenomonadaceae bacterium]
MRRRDKIALQKILNVIDETNEFLENVSEEEFLKNNLLKSATAMSVIRIGELVKSLSDEFRKQNSQVEWRDIAGFRDIAAHKYETINMEQLYGTAKKDFPKLKMQIEKIMEEQKCTNM